METEAITSESMEQGDASASTDQTQEQEQQQLQTEQRAKIFTQAEVDAIVSARLLRERQNMDTKIEKARSEAASLATMSAEDRAREELKRERESYEQERAQFLREKMELETTKELTTRKLPSGFARFLVGNTPEETKLNIDEFQAAYTSDLEAAVALRMVGNPPKATGSTMSKNSTNTFMHLIAENQAKR